MKCNGNRTETHLQPPEANRLDGEAREHRERFRERSTGERLVGAPQLRGSFLNQRPPQATARGW